MRADHASSSRIPARAEIFDVDSALDRQSGQKRFTARGDPPFQKRRQVGRVADAPRGMDGARLLERRPAAHRDEKFFGQFDQDSQNDCLATESKISLSFFGAAGELFWMIFLATDHP